MPREGSKRVRPEREQPTRKPTSPKTHLRNRGRCCSRKWCYFFQAERLESFTPGWRNWQTQRTQNHPYKLFCIANPPVFSAIFGQLTPLVYLHKPYTVWPFSRPDRYARETHDPRRQSPRLQARQQQSLAVFDLPRRQEPKGFNQGRRPRQGQGLRRGLVSGTARQGPER